MIWKLFLFISAASPVLTSVVKELINSCSIDEFSCDDGICVKISEVCDGRNQCVDGSDEASCYTGSLNLYEDATLHRMKRQLSSCRRDQWQCRDGTCISFDGKCDGIVDCPDRSDETHALCRNSPCQYNLFRCTYGACVDGTAPCNNIQECADNSDELLPRCRNETEEVRGQFKCLDGNIIPAASHCDGVTDCPDGSDETVRACAAKSCPSNLFQCAYGACVDQGADCNKVQDCADGSDEAPELCNTTSTVTTKPITPPKSGACILPPQPDHGSYVSNRPNALPGQAFESLTINVTCNLGYGVVGSSSVNCVNDFWSESIPKCVRMCQLRVHISVEYYCQVPNLTSGFRVCGEYEPSGTVINPICRTPNYYSDNTLTFMHCRDGIWNYVARCKPECGKVTPKGSGLIIGGRPAEVGEVSWHAGIYTKTTKPYKQICGGSIISNDIVISAAHCFWNNALKMQRTSNEYAAAVGKLYRPFNDMQDESQKFDVANIRIPVRYRGIDANYQDDIALVMLTASITYMTHVRPVCLNFDINFDRQQLQPGRVGKVAGWGLTGENSPASQVLKVVELPYVEVQQCIDNTPPGFTEFITSDKICAGYTNGTALCHGDSGGGLAFPESERGVTRYYLRGLVSTAPTDNDNDCNAHALTSFTQVLKHEHFIRQYWVEQ